MICRALIFVILPKFQNYLGFSLNVLRFLAALALVLFLYSLLTALFISAYKTIWLKAIILANGAYCLLTTILLLSFFKDMQILGWVYFLGEVAVILTLLKLEYLVLGNWHKINLKKI